MTTQSDFFSFGAIRALVRGVLLHPEGYEWSVQGFGMMRTYFGDKEWRLNIWDSSLAVPGVSTIHNHPWHFDSTVIAGEFKNIRYYQSTVLPPTHHYSIIKTGEGGGPDGESGAASLYPYPPEIMGPGSVYQQLWHEIHESVYIDGTVTLNLRKRVGDGEHASVFWPLGKEWVDAEPRTATKEEILAVTQRALSNFSERKKSPSSLDRAFGGC